MKLCLGTYLKIIVHCSNREQQDIVRKIMHYFDGEVENYNNVKISKLVGGINNPSPQIKKMAQDIKKDEYEDVSEYFKEVIVMLDPNKNTLLRSVICDVVMKDNTIENDTIVDLISGTKKINLEKANTDLASFLAGILLYVMINTKNNNCNQFVKELNDEYFEQINKKIADRASRKNIDSNDDKIDFGVWKFCLDNEKWVDLAAREFCTDNEKEIELLPLCQIAHFIDPNHKNIRNIYTNYNKYTDEVRKRILELKGVKELDFADKNWIDRCICLYEKRITEMELATNEFLYEGAKYLHRAYQRYSDYEMEFDPYIFDKIDKTETIDKLWGGNKTSLGGYIGEYLFHKKNRPEQMLVPPMNKVQDVCNWTVCSEYEATFWVCKFIIESCYHIQPSAFIDNKGIETYNIADLGIGDSEYLIQRQEDMYYYALLQLYKCFYYRYD